MTSRDRYFRPLALLTLLGMALLAGCASLPGPPSKITLDSDPQGAQVAVDGREIGTTPLPVVLDQVFPMHWTGRVDSDVGPGFAFYRRLETVTFKKDGCDPYTSTLTGDALTHDVKVTLKCNPNYKPAATPAAATPAAATPAAATPAAATPAAATPAAATPAAAPQKGTIEQRLEELKSLKEKGLITDNEYRKQRQRILNQL